MKNIGEIKRSIRQDDPHYRNDPGHDINDRFLPADLQVPSYQPALNAHPSCDCITSYGPLHEVISESHIL